MKDDKVKGWFSISRSGGKSGCAWPKCCYAKQKGIRIPLKRGGCVTRYFCEKHYAIKKATPSKQPLI